MKTSISSYMKPHLSLILFVLLAACKQDYVKTPKALPTVKKAKVVQLERSTEPLPVYASGKIKSLESIKLSFKTGGIIQSLAVAEGTYVRKGQVLATLDLSEIDAQVRQAQANVEKLERDLGRFQRLYADSAATLQSVQDIETGLDVAQSQLKIAAFNQSYSKIVAPVSGVIQKKMVEVGELVSPGAPIYTIGSRQAGMSLRVSLADRDVVKVSMGDRATLAIDAYAGLEAEARVTEIAAEGHPRTGTFEVELTVENFPYELKSGFFAKATVYPSQQQAYYKIPMHAIIEGLEEQVAIYVPDREKVKKKLVKPDFIGEDFFTTAITSFDQSTPRVLTDGASFLREGEAFETLD